MLNQVVQVLHLTRCADFGQSASRLELFHHLLDLPVAERVAQVPVDGQGDDLGAKMLPLDRVWLGPWITKVISLSIQTHRFCDITRELPEDVPLFMKYCRAGSFYTSGSGFLQRCLDNRISLSKAEGLEQ